MKGDFNRRLVRSMLITGVVLVPPGLVLAGVFGGGRGLAGAAVGFAVAGAHSASVILILTWAVKKPPVMLPSILMISYFARLAVLAGVLYGLHFIEALNMIALLACFLAMYLTHTGLEMYFAWKSLGLVSRDTVDE